MRIIQPGHLNGNVQHEALKAACATPFPLSFQSIKLPPVMTSYAIIALTTTFLSYAQLVYCLYALSAILYAFYSNMIAA